MVITMKREIEIKASVKEVAELLFKLDNKEVAEVFTEWKRLFDECYESRKREGKPIHVFDLSHFMMYVIPEMDDEGIDVIRSMYSSLIYHFIDDVAQKYKTTLFL